MARTNSVYPQFGPGRIRPAAGNTGYTEDVAKVMVSLPDDLLARIDAEAQRHGTTRSGMLRRFAATVLDDAEERRRREMRALNERARPRGGASLAQLKAGRPG